MHSSSRRNVCENEEIAMKILAFICTTSLYFTHHLQAALQLSHIEIRNIPSTMEICSLISKELYGWWEINNLLEESYIWLVVVVVAYVNSKFSVHDLLQLFPIWRAALARSKLPPDFLGGRPWWTLYFTFAINTETLISQHLFLFTFEILIVVNKNSLKETIRKTCFSSMRRL